MENVNSFGQTTKSDNSTFDNDNGTTERAILTKGGFTQLNSSTTSLQVVKTRSEFQMETNRIVLDIDSASCVKRIN